MPSVPETSAAALAEACGGRLHGDASCRVRGIRSLEAAGPHDLSHVSESRAAKAAASSSAGVLLVRSAAQFAGRTVIEVDDPVAALAKVLLLFFPRRTARPGVHPTAVLFPGAVVDVSAEIGPFAVVGEGTRIGPRVIVEAHAVLGCSCLVGEDAWIHPHVVLYDGVRLGPRTEVHSGTVLGADGFGYVPVGRSLVKVPQVGGVEIEADVEIGANSCVDRATLEATRVGAGTKVDDLVMIGHNCEVGRSSFLCGQVGLAGSTIVGDGVTLAGQVGSAGHLRIGNGVKAGGQSGINVDVPDGESVNGSPHMRYRDSMRSTAEIRRLPETARLVRALAARLSPEEKPR